MNKEKTSFQNKIICSTYEIFRFILFPLVLFGVFYVSKLSNILNYTNKSENNYRIILISLIITNVIFNVIETFLFENHKTNGFEYLIITLATLILSVMFFMKKILLKNIFIVIFALNVFLIVFRLLWENIFVKLHDYCYPQDVRNHYIECEMKCNKECYQKCFEESSDVEYIEPDIELKR